MSNKVDVAIVGAGAAGLATAIFLARRRPDLEIAVLDGARTLGAKILVSGGGRCNVTNTVVTERDFFGGNPNVIRRVLKTFPASRTVAFFRELGVALHEEENGKLFPDTNRARTVLEVLLAEVERRRVEIREGWRVQALAPGFVLSTNRGSLTADRVVLATGGLSLPKTGSDGHGYTLAARLGHGLMATTPALVPLVLDGHFHARLAGVSHRVEISVAAEERKTQRFSGSLLWTHFGVSGPVVLDASRVWHRAKLEARRVQVSARLAEGRSFEAIEAFFATAKQTKPRAGLQGVLSEILPASMAAALISDLAIDPFVAMTRFSRADRRKLAHALSSWAMPVRGSRGYNFAEVTAGGIPLDEIDAGTLESRKRSGLFLVGEILDVDGRIGGFNFQWAWSSAWVAASGLARS